MPDFQIDEPFSLPVEYKGKEIIIPGRLVRRGYSYKIHMEVDGGDIIFEPDEERNFRAVSENVVGSGVSIEIIRAIAEALEKYLR